MHPQGLRELVHVFVRPLSIIFEQSYGLGEVPEDRKRPNVTPVLKKGKKEELRNQRPTGFTLIPGKVIEKNSSGKHFQIHERQEGDQEQSA